MYFNNFSEDLRSIKTEKALSNAMFSLLKTHTFKKITVKGICEEALVCRAAFYAHFIDKYDLLKYCIHNLLIKKIDFNAPYQSIENQINVFATENSKRIKNLFDDADEETLSLLLDALLSTIDLTFNKGSEDSNCKNVVLSSFYAGGLISYLWWQIKNRFPIDVPTMNEYLFDMINKFKDLKTK